ncbi:DUF222 domain-containing protein [Brevibacterium sp. UCMA 11754]|uniref:DUF222 domain-containing protein n=1 Tax=Brevibacterium sp. UCMA 11754 TaxID=2749198 RepID=UPI001F48F9C7|nr:DUF222 domain-containing protein [Brevibacterium sp. UCMA 11754]
MPNTFKALSSGEISEDKARIMVDETACLPSADRRKIDTRMKSSMGPSGLRSLRTEARALAEEMNDEAAAERVKRATANRRVTMTPLDDGMGRVSAILPIQQAVAVYEGLREKRQIQPWQPGRHRGAGTISSWPTPSSSGSPVRQAPRQFPPKSTLSSRRNPCSPTVCSRVAARIRPPACQDGSQLHRRK